VAAALRHLQKKAPHAPARRRATSSKCRLFSSVSNHRTQRWQLLSIINERRMATQQVGASVQFNLLKAVIGLVSPKKH
jgi:hypothetical protein